MPRQEGTRVQGQEGTSPCTQGSQGARPHTLVSGHKGTLVPFCPCTLPPLQSGHKASCPGQSGHKALCPHTQVTRPHALMPSCPCTLLSLHPCVFLPLCLPALAPLHPPALGPSHPYTRLSLHSCALLSLCPPALAVRVQGLTSRAVRTQGLMPLHSPALTPSHPCTLLPSCPCTFLALCPPALVPSRPCSQGTRPRTHTV